MGPGGAGLSGLGGLLGPGGGGFSGPGGLLGPGGEGLSGLGGLLGPGGGGLFGLGGIFGGGLGGLGAGVGSGVGVGCGVGVGPGEDPMHISPTTISASAPHRNGAPHQGPAQRARRVKRCQSIHQTKQNNRIWERSFREYKEAPGIRPWPPSTIRKLSCGESGTAGFFRC